MKVHVHIDEIVASSKHYIASKVKSAPTWYDALLSTIKGSLRKVVFAQIRIGEYSHQRMYQETAYKEHSLTAANLQAVLKKKGNTILMYGNEKSGQKHFYHVSFYPVENECPWEKIVNPATGRCVKIDGAIGRKLLKI